MDTQMWDRPDIFKHSSLAIFSPLRYHIPLYIIKLIEHIAPCYSTRAIFHVALTAVKLRVNIFLVLFWREETRVDMYIGFCRVHLSFPSNLDTPETWSFEMALLLADFRCADKKKGNHVIVRLKRALPASCTFSVYWKFFCWHHDSSINQSNYLSIIQLSKNSHSKSPMRQLLHSFDTQAHFFHTLRLWRSA